MRLNFKFYRMVFVFLIFTAAGKLNGNTYNYAEIKKNVETIVSNAQVELDAKSVMVLLTIGGTEVVNKAYGISSTGTNANKKMHFRVGLLNSTVFTTMMLQLVDRGKMSLDDKLSKWYPDLPNADIITMRMLANSTTGYFDFINSPTFVNAVYANPFMQWTPDELVAIAVAEPVLFPPGTNFNYSHTNFVIIGQILEIVSGIPINKAVEQYVLDPLNLLNTQSTTNSLIQKPALHGYTAQRGFYEDCTNWNPSLFGYSTLITSNLSDAGKLTRALGKGQLISKKSYAEFLAPTTAGLGPWTSNVYFGFGALIDYTWMFVNPGFNGYFGVCAYLPSEDITIVVYNTVNEGASGPENLSEPIFFEIVNYLNTIQPIPIPIPPP